MDALSFKLLLDAIQDPSSIGVLFFLSLYFTTTRGIPWIYKWAMGQRAAEIKYKEDSRTAIQRTEATIHKEVLPALADIQKKTDINTKRLDEINGSFHVHVNNEGIHTSLRDILEDPLTRERIGNVDGKVTALDKRFNETVQLIFERLNQIVEDKR